jgi:transcriptional regulator with XRE-family HTH domain
MPGRHALAVPTRDTPRQRGAIRGRALLRRLGEDLRQARTGAGLSLRSVGSATGISHTQVARIERGEAPHVDLAILATLAEVVGHRLTMAAYPDGPPVRDRAHLALLARLHGRVHPDLRWRTEVPVPIAGDRRSGDAIIEGRGFVVLVEAETHLSDVQAVERRVSAKARDLGVDRIVLLLLDSRHHRTLVRDVPDLRARYPVPPRRALAALARGEDPGGDTVVLL